MNASLLYRLPFCFMLAAVMGGDPLHAAQTIRVPLADGFDLPVGKPDAAGYYVYRGYFPGGHLGEDWNGNSGGNTDLGDPVYASGAGVVVFSEDYLRGWGNVVIVRHAYLDETGRVTLADSLYGHLDRRMVRKYQLVTRGQQLGTIGTAHGKYTAHLHFEVRKNTAIGMARSSYDKGFSNYFSPRQFIAARRALRAGANVAVPVDTFGGQVGPDDDAPPTPPELAKKSGEKSKPLPTRDGDQKDPVSIPTRASSPQTSQTAAERETQLQKLIEENRRKVDALKDDDLDGFWSRLKKKLDK